jgi:REP element-mobilizing transposase RayT
MPTRTSIPYSEGIFSITFTCYRWIPLIEVIDGYDIVYNWFDRLKYNGHYIIGYVIMPNHLHCMIGFRSVGQSINTIIGNGKRFMAYAFIDRLERNNELHMLARLSEEVEPGRRLRNKQHNVWELSFDWKSCESGYFILQKLEYYHMNPCRFDRPLCIGPLDYTHSSAKFYATGEQGIYPVTSYLEMADVNLSEKR